MGKHRSIPSYVARRLGQALALFIGLLSLLSGCHSASSTSETGTFQDPATGLVWQDPLFTTFYSWNDARAACESLRLGGHSDWRLPTISELRTLIQGCKATVPGGSCQVSDRCIDEACKHYDCNGCVENGGPGTEGSYRKPALHGDVMTSWTSSVPTDAPDRAWTVGFGGGHVLLFPKTRADIRTRCVR